MDINKLIKSVKMDIGMILDSLPFVKDSTEYVMDILDTKTMPSINIVYPYIMKTIVHREELIEIPQPEDSIDVKFRIPSRTTEGMEIMSIRHVRPVGGQKQFCGGDTGCDYSYAGYNQFGRRSVNPLYEAAWATNIAYADAKLAGLFTESMTPKFESPNIVSFNKKYASFEMFEFEFCLENDPSLMNLPSTVFDSFKELLLLDVQTTIYNQYKLFENVDLPIGSLNLMISEWSGSKDRRDELYKEYKEKTIFRTGRIIAG